MKRSKIKMNIITNKRKLKEKIFLITIFILSFLTILPLFHILISVFVKGFPVLIKGGIDFLTGTLPPPGQELGGIGPAIVGTFLLVFLSSILGIPIAVIAGIFAYEYPNSFIGRGTKLLLQIMMEFPTILVGLFAMYIVVVPLGTYSAIAGAFALAIIIMPYVAIATEEALREVPKDYKEAAYSLGLTKSQVIFRVLIKIARRGILTGILIGMAKAAGETAPLLFTIGGSTRVFFEGIDKPIGAIPLLIYNLVQQPYENYHQIAWGAALLLLLIYLLIFIPIRLKLREIKI